MRLLGLKFDEQTVLASSLILYIGACIVFGGAGREGFAAHGVLQAIAGIGIGLLVLSWPATKQYRMAHVPIAVLLGVGFVGAVQSIPLPYELYIYLPNRAIVHESYSELGFTMGSLPISMDVDATFTSVCYVLTPLFVLLLTIRLERVRQRSVIPIFLCGAGVATVFLGLLQIAEGGESQLYLYDFSNRGYPTAFFSNINHQASMLLMILPFAVYLAHTLLGLRGRDSAQGLVIILGVVVLMLLIGILAAGSVAGYLLLCMILFLLVLTVRPYVQKSLRIWVFLALLCVLSACVALAVFSPLLDRLGATSFDDGETSRIGIWRITLEAISDHWVTGTGLGTYEYVIPLYEDPNTVNSKFVAKAHNEYLQIAMEGGLIGGVLAIIALIWFTVVFGSLFSDTKVSETALLRKCAGLSLLVIILHSLVDYPARTPAIAALLGLCVGLLIEPDRIPRKEKVNSNTARFLEL